MTSLPLSTWLPNVRDALLRGVSRDDVAIALADFDAEIGPEGVDLGAAGARLLDRIGVTTRLLAPPRPNGNLLLYAHHQHPIDAFVLPLLSDGVHRVNVVTLLGFASAVGPAYTRRTIAVAPSFDDWRDQLRASYSNLARASVLLNRLGRSFTQEVTPADGALNRCLRHLREGGDLCLFPTGLLGHARWRSGLGVLVRDYLKNPGAYSGPLHLAPAEVTGHDRALRIRPPRGWIPPLTAALTGFDRPEGLFGAFDLDDPGVAQTIADVLSVRYHHAPRPKAP